ncbi:hypothetical protein [uncultured Chitinophaga sp.]|jgi:hypothetical protein|uniref:glycosyltransferase family 9 protein n=1 Tax=uncultured Chitinophaga sp. TaxID=339340 RepID=UPI0026392F18|nr:hypothetical protein [uncultured Chitinophaga sp.]
MKTEHSKPVTADNTRTLILHDFYNLIINEEADYGMIKQLYVTLNILRHTAPHVTIHINDRSNTDYRHIWKSDSYLYHYLDDILFNRKWEDIDFTTYQLVIVHPATEKELYTHLNTKYGQLITAIPEVFSFIDLTNASNGIFKPVTDLFREKAPYHPGPRLSAAIRGFKYEMNRAFTGMNRDKQQQLHARPIEKIISVNHTFAGKSFNNILLLDDYQRKFYLGDSCFWLMNMKEQIISLYKAAKVRINCCNEKRFEMLNKIFTGSFGNNVSFTNTDWKDLDMKAYDLIICHADLVMKFLNYLSANYTNGLPGTSIYCFSNRGGFKDTPNTSAWDSRLLQKNNGHPTDALTALRKARKNDFREILITEQERQWADSWLQQHQIEKEHSVVVLLAGASVPQKSISFQAYIELIKWFTAFPGIKVLVFDEHNIGRKAELAAVLSSHVMSRVIVAGGLGIRKDMALLSSRYISAVIGPCTGMLHLANGIYYYLKNKNIIESKDIPLLLTYTGDLSDHESAYHPRFWWTNTMVKCAIISKDVSGRSIVRKLSQCPLSVEEYQKISLPVSMFTGELLITYIRENFPHFMSRLTHTVYTTGCTTAQGAP